MGEWGQFLLLVGAAVGLWWLVGYVRQSHENYQRKTRESANARLRSIEAEQERVRLAETFVCHHCGETARVHQFHGCRGSVNAVEDRRGRWKGVVLDTLKRPVWRCTHRHPSRAEAKVCACSHLRLHEQDECRCAELLAVEPRPEKGFWASETAMAYLVSHARMDAIKVGVSKQDGANRLAEHTRHGWAVERTWLGLTPELASTVERSVIRDWRVQGIPYLSPEKLPQGGYSETAPLSLVPVHAAVEQVEQALAASCLTAQPPRGRLTPAEISALRLDRRRRIEAVVVADQLPKLTGRTTDWVEDADARLHIAGLSVAGHRQALNSLAGGRSSSQWEGWVCLTPEPKNIYDPFAIKVMAQGRKIGYVPAKTAALIQPQLMAHSQQHHAVVARARVAWHYINRRERRYTGYLRLTQHPILSEPVPLTPDQMEGIQPGSAA